MAIIIFRRHNLSQDSTEGQLVIGSRQVKLDELIRIEEFKESDDAPVFVSSKLEDFFRKIPKGYCIPESQIILRAAYRAQRGAQMRSIVRQTDGGSTEVKSVLTNNLLVTQLHGPGYDCLDDHLRRVVDETGKFEGHEIRDPLDPVALYLTRPVFLTRGVNAGKIAARRKWNHAFCLFPTDSYSSKRNNSIGQLIGNCRPKPSMQLPDQIEQEKRYMHLVSLITGFEENVLKREDFSFLFTDLIFHHEGPIYQVSFEPTIPGVTQEKPVITSITIDSRINFDSMAYVMETPKYTRKLRTA